MQNIHVKLFLIFSFLGFYSCSNDTSDATEHHQAYKNPTVVNYTNAIQLTPNDASLYYKRSLALSNINKDDLALADIEKAIKLDPNNDIYWAGKGELMNYLQKHDHAVLAYNKAMALVAQSTDTTQHLKALQYQLFMGKSLLLDNKTTQAKGIVDKVLSAAPDFPDAYYLLAQVVAAEKDTNKAERYLIRALNLDPAYYEASLLLAEYYSERKDERALKQYLYTFNLDPNEVYPLFQIGYYFENIADTTSAIKAYKKVIEHDLDYTDAYLQLGRIYASQGNWQAAKTNFQLAVYTEPANAKAHYLLGNCFEQLQNSDSAKLFYANATALDPKFTTAKEALKKLTTN